MGRPLGDFLADGPLPAAEAVAVTLAVLSALGSLHRSGRVHGAVSEDAVGVAADGWIRLAAAAAADGRRGREGDVSDTGLLLCRLLGAPPQDRPGQPAGDAEEASPALVAVARSLAGGGAWTADEAWSAVKDAAGYWGSEPQLVRALAGLADRVEGATALERAVTRVVIGPPLREEPLPAPRRERPSLPAMPELPAMPAVSMPKMPAVSMPKMPAVSMPKMPAVSMPKMPPVSVPKMPAVSMPTLSLPVPRRPGRRVVLVAVAALVAGILVGGAAGLRGALIHPRSAAAAQAPKSHHAGVKAPAQLAGLYAQTPSAAVSMFFQLVREQKLDQAALLWKPKMSAAVDLRSRFSGITGIDLRRADTVAEDDSLGIATVEVDWVETHADGSTHEYIGEIYADTGPVLWRWDSWHVHEVVQDSGGDGEGG